MQRQKVKIPIDFASIVNAIKQFGFQEKYQLWKLLYEEIEQADEDIIAQNPRIKSEIQSARETYKSGEFITLNEYKKIRNNNPKASL